MSDDPLASWNHGSTKVTLLDFIARVTKEGTADFVPPEMRIATFDNDGTALARAAHVHPIRLCVR